MKSDEYKTIFKSFLYFNIYDQNLSKDFLNNPYENSNNNNKDNINMISNDNKTTKNVVTDNKSFNLYMKKDDNLFNKNNY